MDEPPLKPPPRLDEPPLKLLPPLRTGDGLLKLELLRLGENVVDGRDTVLRLNEVPGDWVLRVTVVRVLLSRTSVFRF